ncbi:MAG: aminotransferase class V-fold PLP-dependent enzyme [Ancalomicrobiaceae bacterium]|nr:aminotransferase class V-fold PLP-dependent enzyme [Ancalomicrobiaceae bacterium]
MTMTTVAGTIYARLGISRVINAADTFTALGGGPLPEPVLTAMREASTCHIQLVDLLDAIGARIAELTGNEAALVTSGAATAITLAVAGAIAGSDPAAVEATPDHRTDRREVVVLCAQRNQYDRMLRLAGGRLVVAGYSDGTAPWQLEAVISERTAAILWFAGSQFENYALDLDRVLGIARRTGVPVIVDAAAQIPPAANMRLYTGLGADAVAFSGGKGLRGPQGTGLLLGRGEFVARARAHAFPRPAIGRAMKVSKEDACGLLAAVELALSLDQDAEYARYRAVCERLESAFAGCRGVNARIVPLGNLGQAYPRLRVDLGPDAAAANADAAAAAFLAWTPPIVVGRDALLPSTFFLNPFTFEADEEADIVEAIRTIFGRDKK